MGTRAEFYEVGKKGYLAVVSDCGAVPRQGDVVNIAKQNYSIVAVDWCVDHAGRMDSELRANIIIKRMGK